MQLILNNPYRTLGLLVGATAKVQERQVRRLKQLIDAGEIPQEDFSFPCLGPMQRNAESINVSSSKLNLDIDRISAALFWFYNGNAITDEPAFDCIKEGNIKEAVSIWAKLTNEKDVDKRNASAYQNLSTLLLNSAINHEINPKILEKGIRIKLKFLESDFSRDLKEQATDVTYKSKKRELQLLFLSQLQSETEKYESFNSTEYLEIINKYDFSAKEEFLKIFIQKPLKEIEINIAESKQIRMTNIANAINAANILFDNTSESLVQLDTVLGPSNIKYITFADKVAAEILQCGIDYFKYLQNSDTDPGSTTMDLFLKASKLSKGDFVKQRLKENTENLREWIGNKPARDKQRRIKNDVDFINDKLNKFKHLSSTIENANDLVVSCKPKIFNIKKVIGYYDSFYFNLSTSIVEKAQKMLFSVVKEIAENTSKNSYSLSFVDSIKKALDVAFLISSFDMDENLKSQFYKDFDSLKAHAKKHNISTLSQKEQIQNELYLSEKRLIEIKDQVFNSITIDRIQEDIKEAENTLTEMQDQKFYEVKIRCAHEELDKLKVWRWFRSRTTKQKQIYDIQLNIKQLLSKSEQEKNIMINIQKNNISILKDQKKQLMMQGELEKSSRITVQENKIIELNEKLNQINN